MAVQRNGPGAGLAYADRSLFLRRLLGDATQPHTNGCEGAQFVRIRRRPRVGWIILAASA